MAKAKICPICSNEFKPSYSSLQRCCSIKCAREYNSTKEVQKRVKQMKNDLKTHKDYVQILQKVFNTYIRLRDKNCLCVSCGCEIKGSGHASHFFSVGAYPNLRFNEDNVHRSCERCNTHLHGNITNYAFLLPKKIGWERFEKLHADSLVSSKLTIDEILEKITYYKQQIKQITNVQQ
jgi:hypothetical protein